MLLFTHTIAQTLKARWKISVPAMSLAHTFSIARPAGHIFVTACLCFGPMSAADALDAEAPQRGGLCDLRGDPEDYHVRNFECLYKGLSARILEKQLQ